MIRCIAMCLVLAIGAISLGAIDDKKSTDAKKPDDAKQPATKPESKPPISDPKPMAEKKPETTVKPPSKPEESEKRDPADKPDPNDKPAPPRSPIAAELLRGQDKFTELVYAPLAKEAKGNFAYSPFSVSQALSLLSEGARGETLTEMDAVLQVKLAAPQRHAAIAGLNRDLARSAKEGNQLSIANGLWGQPEKPFLPEFLRAGREFYGAELQAADFQKQAEAERKEINAWVAKTTAAKIPEILPPGSLDSTTRLVLVNAIYLKANWGSPFNRELTKDEPFQLAADKSITVAMMHQGLRVPYVETAQGQIAALPYAGDEFEMLVLLPKKGTSPDAFLQDSTLPEIEFRFLERRRKTTYLQLSLPRFELQSGGSIKSTLQQLGMRKIFDRKQADLSGLDAANDLYLGDVFHAAKVQVDEEGTIAAGATAGVIMARGAPQYTEMKVDRPFAFLIRHKFTGTILFVGRVNDPGKTAK